MKSYTHGCSALSYAVRTGLGTFVKSFAAAVALIHFSSWVLSIRCYMEILQLFSCVSSTIF